MNDAPSALIRRFSSRKDRLDHVFLRDRLRDTAAYDRIAGYFRSSIFEIAAEEIARIDRVRIVCNSDLDPGDLLVSQAVAEQKLREKWWEGGSGEGALAADALLNASATAASPRCCRHATATGIRRPSARGWPAGRRVRRFSRAPMWSG